MSVCAKKIIFRRSGGGEVGQKLILRDKGREGGGVGVRVKEKNEFA